MPTPVCPYCLNCFCTAPEQQRLAIRQKLDSKTDKTEQPKHVLYSKPIGTILVECGIINQTDLDNALLIQSNSGKPLGEVLVELGLVTAETMRITLLNQQWIEQIDLENVHLDLRLVDRFGFEFCHRHEILPIELLQVKDHAILRIAIAKRDTLEAIRTHPAFQTFGVLPYLASSDKILELLNKIRLSHR